MHLKKGILLLAYLLLVHLPTIAGELITIKNIPSLKPAIAATLTEEEAKEAKASFLHVAREILSVYIVVNGTAATTPISGRYEMQGNDIVFTPTAALGEDLEFEVVVNLNGQQTTKRFRTPGKQVSTEVTSVITTYPTLDTIPYNTLFFHVRFSKPMMQDRRAYEHMHVFNEDGAEIWNAWRQKSFWLDGGRLLVVMIHPGRVKTGIRYAGPLFDSAKRYKLVVSRSMKDANGNMLAADYERYYYIGGEDRESPKAEIKKETLPAANTLQALTLSFSEGMDYSSVYDGARVYDNKGLPVPCTIEMDNTNRNYSFTPQQSWKKGKYRLSVRSDVYDFAANRINRLFEITDTRQVESDKHTTELSFEIN